MPDQDQTQTASPFAKKSEKPAKKKAAVKKTAKKKATAKKTVTTTRKTTQPKAVDLTKLDVIVLNEDGSDSTTGFTIQKVTSKAIILKPNIPDMRSVVIAGKPTTVDLNFLKRQPEGAKHLGKPVSALIIAIELAG